MTQTSRLSNWFKYERLHHYPELACFEPAEALKRLQVYEKEERDAIQPWLTFVWMLIGAFGIAWVCFMYFKVGNALIIVAQVPLFTTQYFIYLRVRRRVRAKVAAELGDGRLWTCIECGYDLRASADRCPECGAPVRVKEPMA
jgi:hypothetical protein